MEFLDWNVGRVASVLVPVYLLFLFVSHVVLHGMSTRPFNFNVGDSKNYSAAKLTHSYLFDRVSSNRASFVLASYRIALT